MQWPAASKFCRDGAAEGVFDGVVLSGEAAVMSCGAMGVRGDAPLTLAKAAAAVAFDAQPGCLPHNARSPSRQRLAINPESPAAPHTLTALCLMRECEMNIRSSQFEHDDLTESAKQLCDDPAGFFKYSQHYMDTIPRKQMDALQLEGLKLRFGQLRDRVPMLKKLADKQDIVAINQFEDVVPLLFEHTMNKAYPPMLLEQNRFADINRFISKLTTFDLSSIDVSKCECIDDWLEVMDRDSPLLIAHSSGTTGTMSFLPYTKAEWDKAGRQKRLSYLSDFDEGTVAGEDDYLYVLLPYFRGGGTAILRSSLYDEKYLAGSADRFIAAYPYRVSSDINYLAGRLRKAQASGELDRLKISPSLARRKSEFEELEANLPALDEAFFERITQLKGERIFIVAVWNILHAMAKKGLARGMEGLFAPNSIVFSGGGAKGMTPPDNWKDDVCRFLGVKKVSGMYAMSEIMVAHMQCDRGNYHFSPSSIPYLLNPQTSKVLPREGTVTGRAAFFDLNAESHWGGFISGDRITINWDEPCGCGRLSRYVVGAVERFSDLQGGDDKISCAAQDGAHREAMRFLTSIED